MGNNKDILEHIGIPHEGSMPHSGRYPFGTGDAAFQRATGFLSDVGHYRKLGWSENQIAEAMGYSTGQYRTKLSTANELAKAGTARRVYDMYTNQHMSKVAIAKELGIPDTTVGNYIRNVDKLVNTDTMKAAEEIAKFVDKYEYVDVGKGSNFVVGLSEEKFKTALDMLQDEGYTLSNVRIDQMGTGKQTNTLVLTKDGINYNDVVKNRDQAVPLVNANTSIDIDGMRKLVGMPDEKIEVQSIDGKRVFIRYAEEGGVDRDGTMELRRGVDDLNLGKAHYAQVRIGVDGTHYLKGMAVYSDDIPNGYDVVFNTNKKEGTPPEKVFKEMYKNGSSQPFSAATKDEDKLKGIIQTEYIDKDGNRRKSALNIVNAEGDWNEWKLTLPPQFLSKQSTQLAKRQLDLAFAQKQKEFEEIQSLTNPTVKQALLEQFSNKCDSDSVSMKAAALPGQSSKVILPSTKLKENEVYAPTYKNGEHLVLIRYPHAGTFELAEVIVNNKNRDGEKLISKDAKDAIVIHPSVASKLSGADFDGDSVTVVPVNSKVKIRVTDSLPGLKGFEPKIYKVGDEGSTMTERQKGIEMGRISNLITDMTIGPNRASDAEIERAVKHSMVVIDAYKHGLDWKASAKDNRIDELREKYQPKAADGEPRLATLITRAKSEIDIPEQKQWFLSKNTIDSEGRKLPIPSGRTYLKGKDAEGHDVSVFYDKKKNAMYYTDKKTHERVYGTEEELKVKVHKATEKATRMSQVADAMTLSSGTEMDNLYAKYANQMKTMANQARLAAVNTKNIEYSKEANKKYKNEVNDLMRQLKNAKMYSPLERYAQRYASRMVQAEKKSNPDAYSNKDKLKKLKGKAITIARNRLGITKPKVVFTPKQWEAIQAGAIHHSTLKQILQHADMDVVKELAMPRVSSVMTPGNINLARTMRASGYYTTAEIAERLGVSSSSVIKMLKES